MNILDNGKRDTIRNRHSSVHVLARGASINLIGFFVRTVFVFAHSLIAARLFGAAIYGQYSLFLSVVLVLSLLGQLGLANSTIYFVGKYLGTDDYASIPRLIINVLIVSFVFSVFVGIVAIINSNWIADALDEPAIGDYLKLFGISIPILSITTVLGAFTQGFKKMGYKAISLDIIRPGFELILLILLVFIGYQGRSLYVAYVYSLVASLISIGYFSYRVYHNIIPLVPKKLQNSFRESAVTVAPVVSFALPVLATDMLVQLAQRVPVFALSVFNTSQSVGILAITQRLAGLVAIAPLTVNLMLGPMLSDLAAQHNDSAFEKLYYTATRWSLLINLPILVALIVFAKPIMALFGVDFVFGALALQLMALAVMVNQLMTGAIVVAFAMSGNPRINALNEATMLIALIVLILIIVPRYGLNGIAYSILFSSLIVAFLRLVQFYRKFRISPIDLQTTKVLVCCVLMGVSMKVSFGLMNFEGLFLGLVALLLGMLAYIGFLWIFRVRDELIFVTNYIVRRMTNHSIFRPE